MTTPGYRVERIDPTMPLFERVLKLRGQAYGREEAARGDEIDDYSLHFIARQGNEVLGALRVTCRMYGPLESEANYPAWLLREFGDRMCASSRMCVRPDL